jgi:predicted Zn finger-like uncharacterized protein
MIVQCPSCAAKFRVADDKLRPEGVKVRCGRCKTVFRVRRADQSGMPATVLPDPVAPAAPAMPAARAPTPTRRAPIEDAATRVVHDPVRAALEDVPSGLDHPLLATSESPRLGPTDLDLDFDDGGSGAFELPLDTPRRTLPAFERWSGDSAMAGLLPTHHPRDGASASAGVAGLQREGAPPNAAREPQKPDWLIRGSTGDSVGDRTDDDRGRSPFQPPVTDEHAPGGAAAPMPSLRLEPLAEADTRLPPRRDALASLADPMPATDLSWDVEGLTAPRPVVPDSAPAPSPPEPGPGRPDQPSRHALEARAALAEAAAPDPTPAPSPGPLPVEPSSAPPEPPWEALTFSHRTIARDERVAVWLGTALGAVLVLAGFTLFLAARNDWLLDFKALDQMMGVAFAGQTYEPRAVRVVRVYDLDGERLEAPLEPTAPTPPTLQVGNVEQSVYDTRSDDHLLLLEGDLLNHDTAPHRAVFVLGRLLSDEREVARVVAPVGRTLSQEELETLLAPEALDALYATVGAEAAALVIQPSQRSRFSLVFADYDPAWEDDALRFTVEVARAERPSGDGGWERVVLAGEAGEVRTAGPEEAPSP